MSSEFRSHIDGEPASRRHQAVLLDEKIIAGGFASQLKSKHARYEFIQALDGDQFVGLLSCMNAVLLGEPDNSPFVAEVNATFDERSQHVLWLDLRNA